MARAEIHFERTAVTPPQIAGMGFADFRSAKLATAAAKGFAFYEVSGRSCRDRSPNKLRGAIAETPLTSISRPWQFRGSQAA